jgi:hypothetical protein
MRIIEHLQAKCLKNDETRPKKTQTKELGNRNRHFERLLFGLHLVIVGG